jgi:HAMP domain-containing protein
MATSLVDITVMVMTTTSTSTRPRATTTRGADGRPARSRATATRARRDRAVESASEDARIDLLSGVAYDDATTATWESRAPFFYPRLALVGSLALGLGLSLPSSIGDVARSGGSGETLVALAENVVGVGACAFAASRDVARRSSALARLQKELALGKMRVIQRNKFREEQTFALRELRDVARIAVVYGSAEKVERDLTAATPYRRRLEQSRILVVPVVERGSVGESTVADVGPGRWELLKDVVRAWPGAGAGRWLAWPTRNDDWSGYFRRLMGDEASKGGYLTISTSGLIRGSGVGAPNWDVLLSTFPRNRPGNAQDEEAEKAWKRATLDSSEALTSKAEGTEISRGGGRGAVSQALPRDVPELERIISLHEAFYRALDAGDERGMEDVWSKSSSRESALEALVEIGARLDGWDVVLRPDRRPQGIKVNDVDVTIEKGVATLTGLETVTNGATLLCTQTFEREDGDGEWMMTGHTTIPYGADVVAKVVLRCDANGCVALPAKSVASSSSR